MTDERIRAVMPMAGEGWALFGERGLAAVDRSVLIIVATKDLYYLENVTINENLGALDRALTSVIDKNHMMIYEQASLAKIGHFVTTFFGYHLQGKQEYADYLSAEFVNQ